MGNHRNMDGPEGPDRYAPPDAAAVRGAWTDLLLLFWLGILVLGPLPGDADNFLWGSSLHYAAIAKSTLHSGDLLILKLGDEPYFNKPPLLFWIAMAMFELGGATTWTAQLIGTLSALGVIAFTYTLVSRLVDRSHGFLAAALLPLTYVFLHHAPQLRFEAPVTLAVMLSLWAVLAGEQRRRVLPLFWVGVMLGAGLKAAAGLFAIPIVLLWSLLRRRAYPWNVPAFWSTLPLAPLLVAPWIWHNVAVYGDRFFTAQAEDIARIAGSGGAGGIVARYAGDFAVQYLPWLPFLGHGLWLAIRALRAGDRTDRVCLPLAWIAGVLLCLLSLTQAYSRYLFPMVPAWSLLVATSLLTLWPGLVGPRLFRGMRCVLVVATAVLAFTPIHLRLGHTPDVVRFRPWLEVEGLLGDLQQIGDRVSVSTQSAAIFYLGAPLRPLPPTELATRLAERQPFYALRDKHAKPLPAGISARLVQAGEYDDLVEFRLASD